MNPHPFLEQSLAVLQVRLASSPAQAEAAVRLGMNPFLTISREVCAGATTLGRLLLPALDRAFGEEGQPWALLDKDLLTFALRQQQLDERLAEFLPEDRVSEIKAVVGEIVGLHPSIWTLEQQVFEVMLELAHMGRVVLIGRGAQFVTRSMPGGFHVRLIAPFEVRLARLMAGEKCDEASARATIRRLDLARRRYLAAHFDQEIDDPRNYDLVINTARVSAETASQMVLDGMRARAAAVRHLAGGGGAGRVPE